jgi:hypothetical protein
MTNVIICRAEPSLIIAILIPQDNFKMFVLQFGWFDDTSCLYNKHITIKNDTARVVSE